MTITPKITLDQWRALVCRLDAGGYAQAAENLHKSQSAVTDRVQNWSRCWVKCSSDRRKAHLRRLGQVMYRRAKLCWGLCWGGRSLGKWNGGGGPSTWRQGWEPN